MKNNVMFFMPSFEGGGVQRIFLNLAKGMYRNNFNIFFCVADARGEMKNEAIKESFSIIDYKKTRQSGDYKALCSIRNLRSTIRKNKPNWLIVSPGFSSAVAIIACKSLRSKTRIILVIDDKISNQLKLGLKNLIAYFLYKLLYKYADHLIAAHNPARNDLINKFNIKPEKVSTVYHPLIDFRHIEESGLDTTVKNLKNDGYKIITSLGRLVKIKNNSMAIEAFNNIANKYENTILLIVGNGPEKDNLTNLVNKYGLQGRVLLMGYSENPYSILKLTDIFLLTSKKEAFGNVIIEALACNNTIVVPDCDSEAQKDITSNGRYGYLFNVNDVKDLTSKIEAAISNPISPTFCNRRAKDFTISIAVKKYIKIMESIL